MNNLIAALNIFAKYTSDQNPTCWEHDILYVLVDPTLVTAEDRTRLEALGFRAQEHDHNFYSTPFGKA